MNIENTLDLSEQEETVPQEPNYEAEAREMGWLDKEKFKGPEDKWVSAKEFYERGEHLFPLVKATNKRLKNDLLTRDKEIATLKEAMESSQKAIKALQKNYEESTKKQVEEAKRELREQIKAARELGDTDTELDLQDKMASLRNAETVAKEEAEEIGKKPPQESLSPDFLAWNKENPWFGDTSTAENRKRSRTLIRIGEDLLEEGTNLTGRPFMEKCVELLEDREAGVNQKGVSKVAGGAGSSRSSSANGFSSLPKEAKDACHEDNDSFVGPGKMFKTVKEWETQFYNTYNEA